MWTQLSHRRIGFSLLALALSLTVYASTALGNCYDACLAQFYDCVNNVALLEGISEYQRAIFRLDCEEQFEACLEGCG